MKDRSACLHWTINASKGGPIVIRHIKPIHLPKGGISSLKRYVSKAEAEKTKVNASNARPMRVYVAGKQTAASATNHVTYHEKNQGVIRSNAPRVASAASIKVRMLGAFHNQMHPMMRKTARAARLT